MRAILLILLAAAFVGCGDDVMAHDMAAPADMALVGEFCGGSLDPCCPNLTKPCETGQVCRVDARCSANYRCVSNAWTAVGPYCDMAPSTD
jgi:hypothetical protein